MNPLVCYPVNMQIRSSKSASGIIFNRVNPGYGSDNKD